MLKYMRECYARTTMTKLKRMFWKTINKRTNKYESEVKNVLERCKQREIKMTKKERMSKRKLVLFVTLPPALGWKQRLSEKKF